MAGYYNRLTAYGIPYEELEGSPSFGGTKDGFTAQTIWRVPWTYVAALALELFPPNDPTLSLLYQTPPMTFPGFSNLYAQSFRAEPFIPDCPRNVVAFSTNYYTHGARITIDYTSKPWDGSIWDHRVTIGGEMLRLPTSGFSWKSVYDADPANFTPIQEPDLRVCKVVPTLEHSITIYGVPEPPWEAILAAEGHVNSNTVVGKVTVEPETMMFMGCEASQSLTANGMSCWTLEYRFSQKELTEGEGEDAVVVTWNHFRRRDTGKWEKLVNKDGGNMYESYDFDALFESG